MRPARQVPGRVRRRVRPRNAPVRALVWAGIALVTFGWVWLAVLWVPNVVVGVVLAVLALSLVAGVIDWARQGDFRPLDAPGERGTHAVRDDAPAEAG